MTKLTVRDVAEVIGFTSVVGSLIFVGLELRQGQQNAQIESNATRAEWIIDGRNSISEYPEVWIKGNSGQQLTDAEQVIYTNLIRNFHTNNGFSWRRDQELGLERAEFAAEELAWFLYENPAARQEWEEYVQVLSERQKALGRDATASGFTTAVRKLLESFDARE